MELKEARASLIEAVAETSDELMEKYLGDEEISVSGIKSYPLSYYQRRILPSTLWYSFQKQRCSINA